MDSVRAPAHRAVVLLALLSGGCAGAQRMRLGIHAGVKGQGVLPQVTCDIPSNRRSEHGLPLMRVLVEAPCTTRPKVVVFAFDEQRTIGQRVFLQHLDPRQPAPFEVEVADLPPTGTDITVFVWTRCADGEPQQGVDTCQVPP
jgi:hypothetical protein